MKEKRVVIDLPVETWNQTKSEAALAGMPLKEYVTEVLNIINRKGGITWIRNI